MMVAIPQVTAVLIVVVVVVVLAQLGLMEEMALVLAVMVLLSQDLQCLRVLVAAAVVVPLVAVQ